MATAARTPDNSGTSNHGSSLPATVSPPASVVPTHGETSSSAIAAREKAAVEARFLMALHRPRDFDTSRLRLLKACDRPKFAEVARYAKPVGNSRVTGLSVRFAEEARVLWGNMDVTSLLVFDDDERRIYRVQGIDLETNATEGIDVMVEKFVERRQVKQGMEVIGSRQNSTGQTVYKIRATEDDMLTKSNAHVSKARRNVILSLLPGDIKEECEQRIIETLRDRDAKDPDGARKAVMESFFSLGVMPAQVADLLGHPLEQINPAELTLLRSYYTALKDGEATWTEIVEAHSGGKKSEGTSAPTSTATTGTQALKEKLGAKGAAKGAAKAGETNAAPAPAPTTTATDEGDDHPGDVCEACGGRGGHHAQLCPYFAD